MCIEVIHSLSNFILVFFSDSWIKLVGQNSISPSVSWQGITEQFHILISAKQAFELNFVQSHIVNQVLSIFIRFVPSLFNFFNWAILSRIRGSLGGKLPIEFFNWGIFPGIWGTWGFELSLESKTVSTSYKNCQADNLSKWELYWDSEIECEVQNQASTYF